MHVPLWLVVYALKNNLISQLKIYLCLKWMCSGKLRKQDLDIKSMSNVVGIKTSRTIYQIIENLKARNWIGYNQKSEIYFVRSLDDVCKIENLPNKRSAVFRIEHLKNFKAWIGAVCYTYLYRKVKWSKHVGTASKMEKAKQPLHVAPPFLEVSTIGFSKYFQVSKGQASKLKKAAKKANLLFIRKNYQPLEIPIEQKDHFKKYSDEHISNRVRVVKEELVLQLPDLILPQIALSKRKKWKP